MICILVISLPLSQSNCRVSADTFKSKGAQSLSFFLLLVNTKIGQSSQIFWSIILIKRWWWCDANEKLRACMHTFFSRKWNKLSKHWFLMDFHLFVSANLTCRRGSLHVHTMMIDYKMMIILKRATRERNQKLLNLYRCLCKTTKMHHFCRSHFGWNGFVFFFSLFD